MNPAPPVTMSIETRLTAGAEAVNVRAEMKPLLASERDAFAKRGFVVRERVLGEADLRSLRDAVERVHGRIEAAAPGVPTERIDGRRYQEILGSTVKWEWHDQSGAIRSMEPFHHLDPALERVIDDPRVWSPAAELLGLPSVSLFTDKLNFKRPGGSPFPWHQDTPYWRFGCPHVDRLASVQIYLDDADRANGCLWMVPGSHLSGTLPVYVDRGVLGRLYTDIERVQGAEPEPIEAPAGSCIWFHGDVVHGSRSNRSEGSRRALVVTYQPPGLPRWSRGLG